MSLGENIRKYREKNKLTQEKLADKLEVSFQAVSSWERDEYRPDTDNLIKLAEVFETDPGAFRKAGKGIVVFKSNDETRHGRVAHENIIKKDREKHQI